jgi:cytidine deaminase
MSKKLHAEACKALKNAYSPYSKFNVGSAVLLTNGKIYSGCNIENASYGGTVCAERVAIWKALSENPGEKIAEIVVVTDMKKAWPPCGFCRQVIAEFADNKTKIHTGNLKEIQKSFSLKEILPEAFDPAYLQK